MGSETGEIAFDEAADDDDAGTPLAAFRPADLAAGPADGASEPLLGGDAGYGPIKICRFFVYLALGCGF
jgi:hypothetical protein